MRFLLLSLAASLATSCASIAPDTQKSDVGYLSHLLQHLPDNQHTLDIRPIDDTQYGFPSVFASYQHDLTNSINIHREMRGRCAEQQQDMQMEAARDDLLVMVCGVEQRVQFVYIATEGIFLSDAFLPEHYVYINLFELSQPLSQPVIDNLMTEFSAQQIHNMNHQPHTRRPMNDPYIDPETLHQLLQRFMDVTTSSSNESAPEHSGSTG